MELAGMELIFFIAACMVLCSRFVTTAVSVVDQCFGQRELSQHPGFCASHSAPTVSRLRTGGQLTAAHQRDNLCHGTLHSAIKAGLSSRGAAAVVWLGISWLGSLLLHHLFFLWAFSPSY